MANGLRKTAIITDLSFDILRIRRRSRILLWTMAYPLCQAGSWRHLYKKDLTLEGVCQQPLWISRSRSRRARYEMCLMMTDEPVMTAAQPEARPKGGQSESLLLLRPQLRLRQRSRRQRRSQRQPRNRRQRRSRRRNRKQRRSPLPSRQRNRPCRTPTTDPAESTVMPATPDPGQGSKTTEENTVPQTE